MTTKRLSKCFKCNDGFIEESEDYSNETHIAQCNNCSTEFWINYKKTYDLKTMEEVSDGNE